MENFNIRYQPTRPDNKERINQPDIKSKMAQSIKDLHQDPNGPYTDWKDGRPSMSRENIVVANKTRDKKQQSESCRKGTLKSFKDPEVLENRQKGYKSKWKAIIGPDEVEYNNRTQASKKYNVDPRTIGKWCKAQKNGWRYK
jgi:hypothetical protein